MLKQRRRTLKNRGYAANCREKRTSQKEELEMERTLLRGEVQRLRSQNQQVTTELHQLKNKYAALKSFAERSSHGAVSKVIVIKPEVETNKVHSESDILSSQESSTSYETDELSSL